MIRRANLSLMVAAVLVVLIGAGSARADLTDGLIAHWKLDGDANDSAGSNDGTLVNGPIWTTGMLDGALTFDGSNDYVDIGDKSNLEGFSEVSIGAWIYWNGSGQDFIAGKEGVYKIDVSSGKIRFLTGNDWAGSILTSSQSINPNAWYHIVATYNGSQKLVYINGQVDPSSVLTSGSLGTNVNPVTFGVEPFTVWHDWYKGKIDDVRIYDRALSPDEVWELCYGELLGFEIVGPNAVAEDFQAQYRAIANYERADMDVTNSADWSVEPNDIASISAGLLTTETIDLPHDLTIYAEYSEDGNTVEAEKEVEIFAICPSGSALEFDGVDDYVDVTYIPAYQLPEFTVSAWVYPTTNLSPLTTCIIARGEDGSSDNTGLWFGVSSSSSSWGHGVKMHYEDSRDNEHVYDTGFYPPVGVWAHLVATRSLDGHLRIYANGNLLREWTSTAVPSNRCYQDLTIGATWFNPPSGLVVTNFFPGLIDEVAIYNKALSVEQIQELMHIRPASGEPNLVGYWDFDEGEGQVAGDSSGNGNDGTLGSTPGVDDSDPCWVNSVPPVGICSFEGLVERNLLRVYDMKQTILDILAEAMATEEATKYFMDEGLKNGNYGNLKKGDVVKAKQKIHSAIQREEQAETTIGQSLEKLNDALDALGIDPASWHQSEIEEEIIRADINADGVVDFRDFTILTEHWLKSYGP